MNEHIIIKDDKGKKHTFHNLKELVEYLDSFKMSFLPDNFNYEIKTNKKDNLLNKIKKCWKDAYGENINTQYKGFINILKKEMSK
jgi:hypothetical protein